MTLPDSTEISHDEEDLDSSIKVSTRDDDTIAATITDENVMTELSTFFKMSKATFIWGDTMDGMDFIQVISAAYAEIMHWHHN